VGGERTYISATGALPGQRAYIPAVFDTFNGASLLRITLSNDGQKKQTLVEEKKLVIT